MRLAVLHLVVRAGPEGAAAGAIQEHVGLPASERARIAGLHPAAGFTPRSVDSFSTMLYVRHHWVDKHNA
jgi:hypothetical protein